MGHSDKEEPHNLNGITTREYRFSCYKLPRDLDGNIHKKVPTTTGRSSDAINQGNSEPGLIKGGAEFEQAIQDNATKNKK